MSSSSEQTAAAGPVLARAHRDRRPYRLGEEIANSVTHGVGIAGAIAALVALTVFATRAHDGFKLAGAIVFGISLVVEYSASTLYHALPGRAKHVLKILDHAGIYVLIAGSYTPFTLVTIREHGGWWLFGAIWGFAVLGIAFEAFWTYRPGWVSAVIYLGMGWAVIFTMKPLLAALAAAGLWLLVAGGVAYTAGTPFYVFKRVPYFHMVWHLWVIAGSALHVLAVLLYVVR
ncbi:MAG: hemolysin III family protein [Actinobacteria bacterium]|nr:MAG: hemolysin III family protein [Actinomycetota bacterium]